LTAVEHEAPEGLEEEDDSRFRRWASALALAGAAAIVVYLLLFGGNDYTVTAQFQNASQLVKGAQVVVGGVSVGSVESIELGPDGSALVSFSVSGDYAPLRRGTTATVRSYSLSGIANRQVQLTLPPEGRGGDEIPDGGSLAASDTVSEVDLDQVFNTLDPKTIRDFKHLIQGFAISYDGVGPKANRGYRYLNPFLSTSRRLFDELSLDTPTLGRLVVDTSKLSGALAERAPEISSLIHNAELSFGALGRERSALAASISKLPDFMRQSNTTFVNLRATLDDLDPLIEASKPVADRLGPFFAAFRKTAHGSVPTLRDLDRILRSPGPGNDLVELTRSALPLKRAGVGQGSVDCGQNPATDYLAAADRNFSQGALPESACALQNGLPALAFFRAYQPELTGWFNDFGPESGVYDANGGMSRIAATLNTFSASTPGFPSILGQAGDPTSDPLLDTGNTRRCPGANERPAPDGSNPFTDGGTLNCDPSQIPPGP
jgi:phospholipid/cholesterol/gamma-HCH transport system substrate-binding protein